jgi:hypothetical protein
LQQPRVVVRRGAADVDAQSTLDVLHVVHTGGAALEVEEPLVRAIGANPWIWSSPVDDDALAVLVPRLAAWGFDAYHMNIEERDPYAAVTLAGPHIKHVQVSGTNRGAPGSDHLDRPRFLEVLGKTGYTGALCIESFTAENATIATAASIWRPLAPSQDRLALDGLAYLRTVLSPDPPNSTPP